MPILIGVYKSVTMRMSMAAVQFAWREVVPLITAGKLDTAGVFTHILPLELAGVAPPHPWVRIVSNFVRAATEVSNHGGSAVPSARLASCGGGHHVCRAVTK